MVLMAPGYFFSVRLVGAESVFGRYAENPSGLRFVKGKGPRCTALGMLLRRGQVGHLEQPGL